MLGSHTLQSVELLCQLLARPEEVVVPRKPAVDPRVDDAEDIDILELEAADSRHAGN
jgi:hypothetical protein